MKGGTKMQAKYMHKYTKDMDSNVCIIRTVFHNAAKVTAITNTY